MEKQDQLIELLERFSVNIDGITKAERAIEDFKKKWFLTFKKKFERDFLEQITPKLQELDGKFNEELRSLLEKQGEKFLKKFEA